MKKSYWSDLNSLENIKKTEVGLGERQWREIEVSTDTLTNLIDSTPYMDRPLDFLSIDVEGHEIAVLRSLDFERYQPQVICVETWNTDIDHVMQGELYAFMSAKGYILCNWINLNLVFRHQNFPPPTYDRRKSLA